MVDRDFGLHADTLRERLGRYGVWHFAVGLQPASVERDVVRRVEDLGFGAFWFGEAPPTKEAFTHASVLLNATERITVATGIASIWARDAAASVAAAATLGDASGGRFLLGLGVSHKPSVAARGGDYSRPLSEMRGYLDAMDDAPYDGPFPPGGEVPRVIAALRPRMLELARDRTAGAHPYFVTAEHTQRAREILGTGPFLAPEHAFVIETDAARARAIGREYARYYLARENYTNSLRELGFDDADFADDGSDRLIDALVAWGDPATVAQRLSAHLDAGADHVCAQPLGSIEHAIDQLEALAAELGIAAG